MLTGLQALVRLFKNDAYNKLTMTIGSASIGETAISKSSLSETASPTSIQSAHLAQHELTELKTLHNSLSPACRSLASISPLDQLQTNTQGGINSHDHQTSLVSPSENYPRVEMTTLSAGVNWREGPVHTRSVVSREPHKPDSKNANPHSRQRSDYSFDLNVGIVARRFEGDDESDLVSIPELQLLPITQFLGGNEGLESFCKMILQ